MKEQNFDPLFEWAIWGHLQSKTDLELLLLKGHLLLEMVLETALKRQGISDVKNFSFYRKTIELKKSIPDKHHSKEIIINSLIKINKLRNELAHNYNFDIKNSELESWASDIIKYLNGTKWSKFTFRIKIVHAFSILSINILSVNE